MILSAQSIRQRCQLMTWSREVIESPFPLIRPFHERTVLNGMTFGLSGAGYDVRIAQELMLTTDMGDMPLHEPWDHRFALASTMEEFDVPDDLMMMVMDKSSWARQGLSVFNTCAEPGWKGFLTLELTLHGSYNHTLIIPAGAPIAQVVFYRLDEPTTQPYRGRYQNAPEGPQSAIEAQAGDG